MADPYPITVNFARSLYENGGGGHDFDHVLPRHRTGRTDRRGRRAPIGAVVRTAALLHDIGENEGREDHRSPRRHEGTRTPPGSNPERS